MVCGWMDGWMDGWITAIGWHSVIMDGWHSMIMDEWMDEWITLGKG
jgi:hypothetical protein